MKKVILWIAAFLWTAISDISAEIPNGSSRPDEMDKFITELMSKMTIDEKIGQLNLPSCDDIVTGHAAESNVGALVARGDAGGTFNVKSAAKVKELQHLAVEKSRLGIPLLIGLDVIHGYETIFPIPLALSCSWDMNAIERSARVAATEASAAGINWTFSPMADISRDPRWGRVAEGAGEDPYLGSEITRAMVRGYQGSLKNNDEILACVKHFALYGASEAGRDYNTVDMSRGRMYNEYFAPYKAACDEGVATLMTSFNLVDGIPATSNPWLLDDVLRRQWKFDGMVVTDYGSIGNIRVHGLEPLNDASAEALKAGTDMDMCSNGFLSTLKQSLAEGKIDIKDIDRAVRRVLEAKYRLGLFDDPYKYNDTKREKRLIYSKEHRDEARAIAAKTFVLLKNENALLPLDKKGKIALIGPLADAACEMPGTWSVAADCSKYKTLKQALGEALDGKASLLYAQGARFDTTPLADRINNGNDTDSITDKRLLNEALDIASKADVIVAALGEDSGRSGESSSLTDLSLPAAQRRLLEALLSTGKPVVMLNFAGRPTVLTWESENVPAILNVWFGGSEAPDAIADIIFGDVNPSGKLSASMPWNVGQIPVYYNHLNTGHPIDKNNPGYQKFRSNYIDAPNEPLYPFGYGLSYTDFEYSGFRIDGNELREDKPLTATVTVTNTGRRDGDEIVQFYIRDVQASVARPVKELKHFERISLKPGEKRDVSFKITPDDLKFYNRNLEYVAEPGEFQVMAGPDSKHVSTLSFSLVE